MSTGAAFALLAAVPVAASFVLMSFLLDPVQLNF
jgi:hypothetical protein